MNGTYSRPRISYGLLGPPDRIDSTRGAASGTRSRPLGGEASGPSRPTSATLPPARVADEPPTFGGADAQPASARQTTTASHPAQAPARSRSRCMAADHTRSACRKKYPTPRRRARHARKRRFVGNPPRVAAANRRHAVCHFSVLPLLLPARCRDRHELRSPRLHRSYAVDPDDAAGASIGTE